MNGDNREVSALNVTVRDVEEGAQVPNSGDDDEYTAMNGRTDVDYGQAREDGAVNISVDVAVQDNGTTRVPSGELESVVGATLPEDDSLKTQEAVKAKRRSSRLRGSGSSAELREIPDHLLLLPDTESQADRIEEPSVEKPTNREPLLQRTCLKPEYSLLTHLMLSFGLVSAVTIFVVMFTCIMVSVLAGNEIKNTSRTNLETWGNTASGSSVRYISEALTPRMFMPDLVRIIHEYTRDRFVGYPDDEGYQDDSNVPFFDISTGENRYPLDIPLLPLDWQIERNVNDENYAEHVQHRWEWYKDNRYLSTASSYYTMQGMCDPLETNPNALTFYPNCTDANNNLTTGGVVVPVPTNELIARKGADLNPILKALYEYHQNIRSIGVYFANAGAGFVVGFPHYELNYTYSYVSDGCEWMSRSNPFNPERPIASRDEIDRCHPKGKQVSSRRYNPLGRAWCRDQALNPEKVRNYGPYRGAWTDIWLMTLGRAVYDRITKEFIGCIAVDITMDWVADVVNNVDLVEGANPLSKATLVTIVRWDEEGTVLASPNWNYKSATTTTTIDDKSLGVGVDKAIFEQMKSLVDFNSTWDPEQVRHAYEDKVYEKDGKLVKSYPMPPPPNKYDPDFVPELLVILSIEQNDYLESANEVDKEVDKDVNETIVFTLSFGFGGLVVLLVIIYVVSLSLTNPLKWMNDVASQIVDKFGKDSDEVIDYHRAKQFRFTPRTELTDVVTEFQEMVSRFSREGTAKVVKPKPDEIQNRFTLLDEFEELYQSRQRNGFKYNYENSSGTLSIPARCHFGKNVHGSNREVSTRSLQAHPESEQHKKVTSSRLFWWILGLIVTPLLVVTITIPLVTYFVTWERSQLPSLISDVESAYVELEARYLLTTTTLRAARASEILGRNIRDLHLLTRVAGWLFFNGIRRSGSFTEMWTAAEQCKKASEPGKCDYLLDESRPSCACEWNDYRIPHESRSCSNYTTDSRYLQRQWYAISSHDTGPNGAINSTSFRNVSYTPNTTAWWDNVTLVPGYEKGSSAAGYETTYDRLRVSSALSAVQMPLYNKDPVKNATFATIIGFEADGGLIGFSGCAGSFHTDFSSFQSTAANGASELRPELCPLGKYGFDARCRGWYDTGKNNFLDGGSALYVTAPYVYANNSTVGQSCSSPLIDPNTQEHIGQVLIDFLPFEIFDSLDVESNNARLPDGGFPVLITVGGGNDAVMGPGFALADGPQPIAQVVLPNDQNCSTDVCSTNLREFTKILEDMRGATLNRSTFSRTSSSGSQEKVYIAYGPVDANSSFPLNSSDFSRGVQTDKSLIFSLALAATEEDLLRPFQNVEDGLQKQVTISVAVLAVLVAVAVLLVIFFSSRLTASITDMIANLLGMIRSINRLDAKDEAPEIHGQGGSSEVTHIYETFEMLYKVVSLSNSTYYTGDLNSTYELLVDALKLFTRLDNKKAVGVANNNLGNTMLTMYRCLKATGNTHSCGLSKKQIIAKGTAYFHAAIKLGEEEYDHFHEAEGWSPNCLVFMQHLSNRYFNRAMFMLTVKEDHTQPDEAEQVGFRDLEIAKNMDLEVVDQCVEVGFTIDRQEHFDILLSRIRGYLTLIEMDYPDVELEIDELIDEAVTEIKASIANPSRGLFVDIGPAGRMQQVDAEIIKYVKLGSHDVDEAARVAVRMLVEDEYTFPEAQITAVDALTEYVDRSKGSEDGKKTVDYLKQLRTFIEEKVSRREIARASDHCDKEEDMESLKKIVSRRNSGEPSTSSFVSSSDFSATVKETKRGDVTMETF